MEPADYINVVTSLIDTLGTVGILVWFLYLERKRADSAISEIVQDWKRQNDNERDQ